MSSTKFAEFLSTKKIDPRRILTASRTLEDHTPVDRAIKLAKRQGKREGNENKEKETRKPRSGRPVTERALKAAMNGVEKLSGPTKTRILKAMNLVLEQKKQDKVELKTLF